jgi:GNAT superfamily N-acetyltransferase
MPLDDATDATIAPVVADAHQNSGFGSLVMLHLMPWLRRLGKRRMVLLGGVRQHNARAIRFYQKWGFRPVGTFTTSAPNIDMVAEL